MAPVWSWMSVLLIAATPQTSPSAASTPPPALATDAVCIAPARPYKLETDTDGDLGKASGGDQLNGPFIVYALSLKAKDAVSFTVKGAGAFPPTIAIGRCVDGLFSRLAMARVTPSSSLTTDRLRRPVETGLTAPGDGEYRVRVSSSNKTVGRFTFKAEAVTLDPPPRIVDLPFGAPIKGDLSNANRQVFAEFRYQLYRLRSDQAQKVLVRFASKSGKPTLGTGLLSEDPWRDYFVPRMSLFLSSQLVVNLVPNAEQIIRVRTAIDDEAPYEIQADVAPPPTPPPPPKPLALGTPAKGALTINDPVVLERDGLEGKVESGFKRYHLYALDGNAGDKVTITLTATKFDPFLEIVAPTILEERLTPVVSNDDHDDEDKALDDRAARLQLTLQAVGTLLVRVTSASDGELGDYVLSAQPTKEAPAPAPAP